MLVEKQTAEFFTISITSRVKRLMLSNGQQVFNICLMVLIMKGNNPPEHMGHINRSLADGGGEEALVQNLGIIKDRSRCSNNNFPGTHSLQNIKQDYEKLQLTGIWKRKWMLFH